MHRSGRRTSHHLAQICAVATSGEVLVVARESGTIQVWSLPRVTLESKFVLNSRPYKIALNSTAGRLSVIDIAGLWRFVCLPM